MDASVSERHCRGPGHLLVDLRDVVRLRIAAHAVDRKSPGYCPVTHLSAPGDLSSRNCMELAVEYEGITNGIGLREQPEQHQDLTGFRYTLSDRPGRSYTRPNTHFHTARRNS